MNNYKHYIYTIFLCVNILMLSACGVKPSHVDPPEGAEHSQFPRTYPDTSTDPKPGMENKSY